MDSTRYPTLTEKERELLELIRSLGFGELHLYVSDGQPVRAEQIKQSVKFGNHNNNHNKKSD